MSTYCSHPVRRIRDRPRDGETVRLVVELGEADPEAFVSTVRELSGTVERELRFDSLLIELPQPAVDELCETAGLVRIETANTLSTAPVAASIFDEDVDEILDTDVDEDQLS